MPKGGGVAPGKNKPKILYSTSNVSRPTSSALPINKIVDIYSLNCLSINNCSVGALQPNTRTVFAANCLSNPTSTGVPINRTIKLTFSPCVTIPDCSSVSLSTRGIFYISNLAIQ